MDQPDTQSDVFTGLDTEHLVKLPREIPTSLAQQQVDFHHKIAYRFEKAYLLRRQRTEKGIDLNLEIIRIISDHSDFIQQDPMALFYCLYFCIFYNNPQMVEFLRSLITKMNLGSNEAITKILENIDTHGIQRLRTRGSYQLSSLPPSALPSH